MKKKLLDRDECVRQLQPSVLALAHILSQNTATHERSEGRHNKRVLELWIQLVQRIKEVERHGG